MIPLKNSENQNKEALMILSQEETYNKPSTDIEFNNAWRKNDEVKSFSIQILKGEQLKILI